MIAGPRFMDKESYVKMFVGKARIQKGCTEPERVDPILRYMYISADTKFFEAHKRGVLEILRVFGTCLATADELDRDSWMYGFRNRDIRY